MLCLLSAGQQSESVIHIDISILVLDYFPNGSL